MIRTSRLAGPALAALCLGLVATPGLRAEFQLGVTINDPGNAYTAYYSPIVANLRAAGAEWASRVEGTGTVEVRVDFANITGANGHSATSGFFLSDSTYSYFEQGAASKIRTGIDLNGSAPDAVLTLGTGYLADNLWFDPDPATRSAPVPAGKIDAYSVFLHELGHVLLFNGWRDPTSGAPPADYMSTFDAQIEDQGGWFGLAGPHATRLYGGPVPLSTGSLYHLDLADDLMNGAGLQPGRRYGISALDLAIAADAGLGVRIAPVPEPGSVVLLALGGLGLAVMGRKRTAARRSRKPE